MLEKQRCLIVDDSDVVRKVMRVIVEDLGFTVEDAANTADAMVRCRPKVPQLVVLDWHIPGSSSFDFLATLRSMPGGRDIKVLYVATNNDPAEIGRAIAAGANDYMIKPFRRVQLEAKIAEMTTTERAPRFEEESIELRMPLRSSHFA